jgi:hypothetical protein
MHEYQGAAASDEPGANNADNNGGWQRLPSFILRYRRQIFVEWVLLMMVRGYRVRS